MFSNVATVASGQSFAVAESRFFTYSFFGNSLLSIQNFGINKAVGGTSYLPSTNFVPPEAIVMNRLVFCIIVLFLGFFNASMRAAEPTQEAQRNLGNTNSHSKFLTAGEVDNWVCFQLMKTGAKATFDIGSKKRELIRFVFMDIK